MRASPGEGERHVHALPLLPACRRRHAAFHRSASGSPTGSHPASGDADVESFVGHVMSTAPVETLRQLLKPRQHFVYLCVHLSRPCWIDGRPSISIIALSPVEDTFCLYAAS